MGFNSGFKGLILQTSVGTHWTQDRPIARSLHTHTHTKRFRLNRALGKLRTRGRSV